MKLSLALMLIAVFAVTSCGKSGGNGNSKKTTKLTEQQIQAVMDNQDFECGSINGGACPEGMARLLILDKNDADKSAVCSGFLVEEDILVTNQHCIQNQAFCNNTYVAIYNGHSYQQTKCSKVIKILNDYSNANDPRKKLDVAIVKLEDRFYGKTFKLAKNRPSVYETVTAWVIDHTGLDRDEPNLVESRITEFKCRVARNPERQALMLERCPIISGNSGSPVFNSAGEVIGIIWGGTTGERVNSSEDLRTRRMMWEEAALTDVFLFKDYIDLE